MRKPNGFVIFSEAFVQLFRVSRDESLTQRLKKDMEQPEIIEKYRGEFAQMLTAAEDERLPQVLQSASDQPEQFTEFCEALVQFFVKLTGDESLPQDLERIAAEGRELSNRIQRTADLAELEKLLKENEARLRCQQEQNRLLLLQDAQKMIEAGVSERIEGVRRQYRESIQAGREAQEGYRAWKERTIAFYRQVGHPVSPELLNEDISEDYITEDPALLQDLESMVRQTADYEIDTIRNNVLAVGTLLNEYATRQRKRRLYRCGFNYVLTVILFVIMFFAGELIDQVPVGVVAAIVLSLVLHMVQGYLVERWLDKWRLEQHRDHIKASLQEFYAASVRARFHLAFVHKYSQHSPLGNSSRYE